MMPGNCAFWDVDLVLQTFVEEGLVLQFVPGGDADTPGLEPDVGEEINCEDSIAIYKGPPPLYCPLGICFRADFIAI